jgi:two-component sensor histidine kinase
VHRLLTETEDAVDAGALLQSIAEGAPVRVLVETGPVALDATTGQKLGIVANELITHAFQHGASPIVVQLGGGRRTRLRVDDSGNGIEGSAGLGLQLVRRMVEQDLRGRFELTTLPGGGTRAEVVFPEEPR